MKFTVNDREHEVLNADHETLLEVLRERLMLTGTKLVCDRGECGACTVLIDDRPRYACLTLAAACEGRRVTTVEGLAGDRPHPVQEAFARHDAAQCGFCTPGQIIAAIALLQHCPSPTDEEIRAGMSGNLCRCGTYPRIAAAIKDAAVQMQAND